LLSKILGWSSPEIFLQVACAVALLAEDGWSFQCSGNHQLRHTCVTEIEKQSLLERMVDSGNTIWRYRDSE